MRLALALLCLALATPARAQIPVDPDDPFAEPPAPSEPSPSAELPSELEPASAPAPSSEGTTPPAPAPVEISPPVRTLPPPAPPARRTRRAAEETAEPSPPPAPRSTALRHLRGATPDRGFGEEVAAYVGESLFGGDYDGGSAFVLATDVGLRFALGDGGRVRVSWGVAGSRSHVVGTFSTPTTTMPYDMTLQRFEARNPDVSLEWAPWVGANSRVLLGVGVAIPTAAVAAFGSALSTGATTPEQAGILDASFTTHAIWLAMFGAWAPWRYQPERIAAFAPLGAYFDLGAVVLGVEAAFGATFPVLGGSGGPEGAVAGAVELSGRPIPELTLGARASLSAYGLGGRGEAAQPAIEPFLRLDLAPFTVTFAGVMNLGWAEAGRVAPPPFGLGSPNGVWALHLGVGMFTEPAP